MVVLSVGQKNTRRRIVPNEKRRGTKGKKSAGTVGVVMDINGELLCVVDKTNSNLFSLSSWRFPSC